MVNQTYSKWTTIWALFANLEGTKHQAVWWVFLENIVRKLCLGHPAIFENTENALMSIFDYK